MSRTDYYPFGMPMPNRQIINGEPYRYAYQGQEKDPETGKEAFQLRLWDARIGRWLTTDPAKQYASPYLGMGNNPMNKIDPDGGQTEDEYRENKDGSYTWVSDLGRSDGLDFVHMLDGTTRIDDMNTGKFFAFMGTPFSGRKNMMNGFTLRGRDVSYKDITLEFMSGTGPENSLFYGSNGMNINVGNTRMAYEARDAFLKGGGDKVGGTASFGLIGLVSAGSDMTEQFMGQSNFSVYPLNDDRVLMMINDSKTFNSVNPLAKFADWINNTEDGSNFSRAPITPKNPENWMSTTRQTYIWVESMNVLRAKHGLYGKY